MRVVHGRGIPLALYEEIEELHGTGTVHRDARHDVLEVGGLELHHELLHAAAFQLEHRLAVPARDERVDVGVFIPKLAEVHLHALVLFDILDRLVDVREGLEPEEVHLEQSLRLHHVLVELRGDVVAVAGEGDVLHDGVAADDHARRVHGGLSGHALELYGGVHHLFRGGIGAVERRELLRIHAAAGGETLPQEHLAHGDVLHPVVGVRVGYVINARDVLHRRLRTHCGIGDDLRHVGRAVFLHHVFDDLGTAHETEVDVKVRHGHALLGEEPLKQQAVPQRVDVRDADGVGDKAPDAAPSPGSHGDAPALRRVDEVPDDEEVVVETAAVDDAELVVQPLLDLRRDDVEAAVYPLPREVVQIRLGVPAVHVVVLVMRDESLFILDDEIVAVHLVRDLLRARDRLGDPVKEALHLLATFEIELVV